MRSPLRAQHFTESQHRQCAAVQWSKGEGVEGRGRVLEKKRSLPPPRWAEAMHTQTPAPQPTCRDLRKEQVCPCRSSSQACNGDRDTPTGSPPQQRFCLPRAPPHPRACPRQGWQLRRWVCGSQVGRGLPRLYALQGEEAEKSLRKATLIWGGSVPLATWKNTKGRKGRWEIRKLDSPLFNGLVRDGSGAKGRGSMDKGDSSPRTSRASQSRPPTRS